MMMKGEREREEFLPSINNLLAHSARPHMTVQYKVGDFTDTETPIEYSAHAESSFLQSPFLFYSLGAFP